MEEMNTKETEAETRHRAPVNAPNWTMACWSRWSSPEGKVQEVQEHCLEQAGKAEGLRAKPVTDPK